MTRPSPSDDGEPGRSIEPSDIGASKAELLSRARFRDNLGFECQAALQHDAAHFHWSKADAYRRLAERAAA